MFILFSVIFIVVITIVLHLTIGSVWTGYLLAIFGIIITITYIEFGNINKVIQDKFPIQYLDTFIKKASPYFGCADLSAILFSTLIFGWFIVEAFVYSVQDLTAKGYLYFPRGDDGIIHLKTYITGFAILPTIMLALATYGFVSGYKRKNATFTKIFIAVTTGFIMYMLIMSILSGNYDVMQGYYVLAKVNSNTLPIGATSLSLLIVLGIIFITCLFWSVYVYAFIALGRAVYYGYKMLFAKYFI